MILFKRIYYSWTKSTISFVVPRGWKSRAKIHFTHRKAWSLLIVGFEKKGRLALDLSGFRKFGSVKREVGFLQSGRGVMKLHPLKSLRARMHIQLCQSKWVKFLKLPILLILWSEEARRASRDRSRRMQFSDRFMCRQKCHICRVLKHDSPRKYSSISGRNTAEAPYIPCTTISELRLYLLLLLRKFVRDAN